MQQHASIEHTVPMFKFVDLGANLLFSNGSYISSQTIIIF
jgi:hypothetical protein